MSAPGSKRQQNGTIKSRQMPIGTGNRAKELFSDFARDNGFNVRDNDYVYKNIEIEITETEEVTHEADLPLRSYFTSIDNRKRRDGDYDTSKERAKKLRHMAVLIVIESEERTWHKWIYPNELDWTTKFLSLSDFFSLLDRVSRASYKYLKFEKEFKGDVL